MISRSAAPSHSNPLIRYVNLTINNPAGVSGLKAEFDHTYDRDILENAGEHMCAIVNFAIPLQNLPLFIFPVELDQAAGPSQVSTIQVGVCHNMVGSELITGAPKAVTHDLTALTWVPQDLSYSALAQNATGQRVPLVSPYYFGYSYEHFVNLVNVAVQTSWVAESSPGGSGNFPVFTYNESTNLFGWILPDAFADAVSSATGWSVCWNEAFDNLMNNFNVINNPQVQGTPFYMLENVLSRLNNRNAADDATVLTQDYPTTDSFNSAQRIVVLTNSIPVAVDYFPSQYNQLQAGGLSNTQRVLADISLDFNNSVAYQRSVLVYDPVKFQYSDLQSTLPLRRVGLRIMWADAQNNFYDIDVPKTDTITLKLGFYSKKLLVNA